MEKIQTLCPHCLTANRIDAARLNDGPKCGKCHEPIYTHAPVTANDSQFNTWVNREQLPLVVDFWATWCGPCQSFAPAFAKAAQTLEPMARFIKVDTEQAQQTAAQFGIRSIPTLMVFRQGQPIAQQAGSLPYPEFLKWLHETLA
ncbi:thioredoxin TrxC [Gilvimarinus sp. SDUM040013]|uniref:Thioredoxin n=1 Tax=Gilvimarinus gilvus TaxID=3058038 RepID=A0ABU4S0E4_9GAMM|nr:thioredoxin TrxC [Gilvimarinus sp. SDUM040013]MDO3385613.1 thioredoxin TrxC [Gilvimarinus sp. SDUM040013]MDX6849947.1 thioredoxin TrxC [Gilvimarinus sp. SDUM040013]